MKRLNLILLCLLFGIGSTIAQTMNIEGIVTDETGESIVGASVVVKGTTIGVSTDLNGKFKLNVPVDGTLVVSFIGYEKKEVKAKANIKIVLKSEAQALDEVVVTGLGKMDKRLFTGATDRLTADEIKMDGLPEISRALEGRSAGVSVQNVSGTFGTAPKIRVRGATSIYGSSKPLWVVDGVIMEDIVEVGADDLSSGDAVTLISSAIAGLNADDIESFQILKDGSATSIYGARAMSGVVVVTTKRGKAGVTHLNYTGEFTTRLKPSYNNFNLMNSQEQMGVYKEMQEKGWLNFSDKYRASNSGVYGKMYQLTNSYNPMTGMWALANTPEARNKYLREAEMRNTDWFDELFRNSVMMNHSLSVSSGSEKATYYASVSVMTDPGWTQQSSVKRYTANANASFNVLKNLNLTLLSNASYRKQKAPGTLSQDVDVVQGQVKRDFDINPYSYALNSSRALAMRDKDGRRMEYTRNYAGFNILNELDNNYIDLDVVDLKFQGELKWKVVPELELGVLGSLKYQATNQVHNIQDKSNQAMAYRAMGDATIRDRNPYLYTDPDIPNTLPISILPNGGIMETTNYNMLGYDFRATATWNHVFNDIHIINVFGGGEVNSVDRKSVWSRGWGVQYSQGMIPSYAYQAFKKFSEENMPYFTPTETASRIVAFYGTATYSYKGKYTANGTIRYEGTNKLGKSRSARWLPTWNAAVAWNMHEEEFLKNIEPIVSHLTLRASYSLTADRGPANVTNSLAIVKSNTPWRPSADVKEVGLEIDELENKDLTYEKKHELNIGADMGFLDNRINLSADWYTRDNYDLIGVINTQGTGGWIQKYANIASMKSHGIELTLSTQNIKMPNFKWNMDIIFSYNNTEVTDLKSNSRVIDLITGSGFAKEGYAVRSLFSIPFAGLNDVGLPQFINESGERTITDINFQERQKVDFLKYEGPTDPVYTGSFGNIFSYKNLRLNAFITYSFGNKIRLDPVFKDEYSDLDAMPKEFKNRWVLPGDERYTNIPVIANKRQNMKGSDLSRAYNAYNYSDVRVADGGFIRMKEISLSYDFPKTLISNWKISTLSLKVQATNLFLIYADSKLNGQDPEFFRSGGVSAPVPKQFTFTLRLGF